MNNLLIHTGARKTLNSKLSAHEKHQIYGNANYDYDFRAHFVLTFHVVLSVFLLQTGLESVCFFLFVCVCVGLCVCVSVCVCMFACASCGWELIKGCPYWGDNCMTMSHHCDSPRQECNHQQGLEV